MRELTLVAEIVLRTALLVTLAELICRVGLAGAPRVARRVWVTMLVLLPLVAASVLFEVKAPVPEPIAASGRASIATIAAPETTAQTPAPWEHVRYRRDREWTRLVAIAIYAMGLLVSLTMLAASWIATRRIVRSSIATETKTIRISDRVTSPVTAGRIILLPTNSADWSGDILTAVIAHESAHVQQRDSQWNAFGRVVCALLWFTPASWIALRRFRAATEHASDAAAAEQSGGSRRYARTLTNVAAAALAQRERMLALAMADPASLSARVERLLAPPRRALSARIVGVLMLAAMAASLLDWHALAHTPLANDPAAGPLLAALDAPDAESRAAALYKLARWQGHEREVLPLLAARLGDTARIAKPPLWRFLRDGWGPANDVWQQPSPGEVAAVGLASMGSLATDTLVSKLTAGNTTERRNAAWALGELRHPRDLSDHGLNTLIAALRDPDATVRGAAAWSLGDIGDARAAHPLRSMAAREKDAAARKHAMQSLAAVEAGLSLEAFRNP